MNATKERFRLPPLVTASNWLTLWSSLNARMLNARPNASPAASSPALTNREAVALVVAFHELARNTRDGFALWHQFAAIAYGWSPEHDAMRVSAAQASRLYPAEATRELWEATKRIATDLETERPSEPARVELDGHAFADLALQGDVRKALVEDGAKVPTFELGAPAVKATAKAKPKPKPQPKQDNTLLLVGLALGALVLVTRRKPRRRRITRRK